MHITNRTGETPVHHAARQGHTATVQYLVEQGADPAIASAEGMTTLHAAAGIGAIELVKFLLSKGVNVDAQSGAGTALMCAAGLGQEAAVKVLLEHHANAGADVNHRAGEATSLLIAAHTGSAEIINCLLQAGADPNAADWDGNTPMHVAASRGNRLAVEALSAFTPQSPRVPERKKATPEAKKEAADAKVRGDEAFKRNDNAMGVDAYTQAIGFDPTDATLFSNRSLCWLRLGQAEHALNDAKICRELKPDWAKACYREGAALRLLQRFEEAANAFHEGIQIDPESKELATAFREAVEAGRKFHVENKFCF